MKTAERAIPASRFLLAAIRAYLTHPPPLGRVSGKSPYLFVVRSGEPLSSDRADDVIVAIGHHAGVTLYGIAPFGVGFSYLRKGSRDRCLLLLLFRHGLRVSEGCGLELSQVDTESRVLHVHRLKHGLSTDHPLRGDELRAISAWLKAATG